MITLAFYKGRASRYWHRVQDQAIRVATRGQYSHVELIGGDIGFGVPVACYSSSGRDGGVRVKEISLKPESWDLVHLRVPAEKPMAFISSRIGAKYDYAGLLFSQVLALARHDESRWFCSEIVAAAMGFPAPQRVSPQLLFDIVTWELRDRPQK